MKNVINPNIDHFVETSFHFFFIQPGSCQMEGIINLYNYISCFLAGILFFVSTLLFFIIKDQVDGKRYISHFFRERPFFYKDWVKFVKSWTHSTELELVWTIIPTLILIIIAVPSFVLLYALDEIVDCPSVVKIIAYQWYWKYEYPIEICFGEDSEVENVSYLSYMTAFEDLQPHTSYTSGNQWFRLLDVDAPLVLPHSVNTKLIITAKDVLHSFAVPSLGIKMDAVPGRLNQVTVFIVEPGIYYGQCSELCGINHAFMPIMLHSISFDCFEFCVNTFLLKESFPQDSFFSNLVEEGSYIYNLNTKYLLEILHEDLENGKYDHLFESNEIIPTNVSSDLEEESSENIDSAEKNSKPEEEKKTGYPPEEYLYLGAALAGWAGIIWFMGKFFYKMW